MKRLTAVFSRIRKSLLFGTLSVVSISLVNTAQCGQPQTITAVEYVKVSTVVVAETNKNMLHVGVDNEAYITVHRGDLILRVGYSLPDLGKDSGVGTHANEQGITPVAGGVMMKLSYAF